MKRTNFKRGIWFQGGLLILGLLTAALVTIHLNLNFYQSFGLFFLLLLWKCLTDPDIDEGAALANEFAGIVSRNSEIMYHTGLKLIKTHAARGEQPLLGLNVLERAAKMGSNEARCFLADVYHRGQFQIPRQPTKANAYRTQCSTDQSEPCVSRQEWVYQDLAGSEGFGLASRMAASIAISTPMALLCAGIIA